MPTPGWRDSRAANIGGARDDLRDPDDPRDSAALVALTELGRGSRLKPHSLAALDQGLNAVRARLATGERQRRTVRRLALLGATAGVCVVVGLKVVSVAPDSPLALEPAVAVSRIEGGTRLEGGYLSQSGAAGVKVIFSEGSKFALMPGTRGRLRSVTTDGAHLSVEKGTASLEITQSRGHRWLVEAGPFLVTVKGTVFTVSWDPASERFELRLRHGRVVVSGPVVRAGVALLSGQRLVVSLPRGETVITEDPPEEPAAISAGPVRPTVMPSAARPSPSFPAKGVHARRWAADLANGHWDRILANVDRDGVDATLENASSEDLFVLADAARYVRRTELARAALLAVRRRFPRSPRSLDALFMLGRVEELREHGTRAQTRPIDWYEEYLAQAPTGSYAAEALGRKMILTNEAGGPAQARPIANEYLLRFPNGSYAGSARALQHAP